MITKLYYGVKFCLEKNKNISLLIHFGPIITEVIVLQDAHNAYGCTIRQHSLTDDVVIGMSYLSSKQVYWMLYKTTIESYGLSRQVVFHNKGNKHDFDKSQPGNWWNMSAHDKTAKLSSDRYYYMTYHWLIAKEM